MNNTLMEFSMKRREQTKQLQELRLQLSAAAESTTVLLDCRCLVGTIARVVLVTYLDM